MSVSEKRAWIMALVTMVAYAIYLAIVVGRAGSGTLAHVPYAWTLVWSVVGAIPVDRVIAEGTVVGLANHTVLNSRDGTRYAIADSGSPIKDDYENRSEGRARVTVTFPLPHAERTVEE